MKKKIFLMLTVFIALILFPRAVNAATNWGTDPGESTSLPCAVSNSTETPCSGEYILTADIVLNSFLRWNGSQANFTIDLNGHNITTSDRLAIFGNDTIGHASVTIKDSVGGGYIKGTGDTEGVIMIQEGHLRLESGRITSSYPNLMALVLIKGSTNPTNTNAASLYIGKNAVLNYEGAGYGYGVIVDRRTVTGPPVEYMSYGISVDILGTIDTTNTTNSTFGLYVNGTIKHTMNYPKINIGSTAVIKSSGPAIYAAGYADWKFANGCSVTGVDSALAIKSGKFTINGGSFQATGPDSTPTAGWNDGVNPSGATIQIESHGGYAGNIELVINGGTFGSAHGYVFYEYLGNGSNTTVSNVEVNNGTFISEDKENIFSFSPEFLGSISGFINGGKFSSDPSSYAAEGVSFTSNNGMFGLQQNEDNPKTNDINIIFIAITSIIAIISTVIIIKKYKKSNA